MKAAPWQGIRAGRSCTAAFRMLVVVALLMLVTTPSFTSSESPAPSCDYNFPVAPGETALQLATAITNAVQSQEHSFTVPAKAYTFGNLSLRISGARNFLLNIQPGTSFFFSLGFGVRFSQCHNVTIQGNGLVLDYATPMYAQGRVMASTSSTIDAEFDTGFLVPDTACDPFNCPGAPIGAHVVLWDSKVRTMISTWPSTPMNFSTPLGEGSGYSTWRIHLATTRTPIAQVGDMVTVFPRRGFSWSLINSSQMVTRNVTLYAGGDEGFTEGVGAGGNVYDGVRVTRNPRRPGLMSINADGFNVDSVGRGPQIINSEVAFNGDDLISVHNRMQVVCNVTTASEALVVDLGQGQYEWDKWGSVLREVQKGDELEFYRPGTLKVLGSGNVAATIDVSLVKTANESCKSAILMLGTPPFGTKPIVEPFENHTIMVVGFTSPLPPTVRSDTQQPLLVQLRRRSSSGAIIRNNHFHDGAQRMAIFAASNLTVDRNVFERTLNSRVLVESEQWALEGSIAMQNVSITNNVIGGHISVDSNAYNVTCHNNTAPCPSAEDALNR